MEHKRIHTGIAVALFLLTEAIYLMTMAPTLSFWDCGEFIATAYTLGVPHPPGAPLFLLIGRVFSMIPFFEDIGARVNFFSTLSAAGTVVLTYLIVFRLIVLYRKSVPHSWSAVEKIAAYGGAAAGALALAFSDSFWFNAVEAEVYAPSLFFTALVVWFLLRWYEDEPKDGNDRWLMAAMYVIGLSIGVHLLSLLAVFAVIMVYYFKKYKLTAVSFLGMALVASAAFLLIYIGIIKGLPVLMQRTSWLIIAVLLGGVVYAIYFAQARGFRLLHTISMSLLLLTIGYTSYTLIYVRANVSPAINENNPSTGEAFYAYLNREQYGDLPLWPRRWSSDPLHQYYYQQYSGEADYFIRYQLTHMYLRYLGWQFIGREHDAEGAGVDWSKLWGFPFLLGAYGAFSHLRRDWKMGSVVTALFILTGAALVVYLNQTEPQPRERDYSYTGSFFAFALWIGIGVESLLARIGETLSGRRSRFVSASVLMLLLLAVDGRMLFANYQTHDRSGNYVPWDWAWNMLQSCDDDAILFTNGDNDTFPLWYLQEVEGIRTDIRIVNLSLANTGWYLDQLKNTAPHGSKPVAFSLTDKEIGDISYVPFEPFEAELPALSAREDIEKEYETAGLDIPEGLLDTIRWTITPVISYQGRGFLRPQDLAVYEIIMNNFRDRPIYFATTVGRDNMVGIDKFLRLDGLAYRVVPILRGEKGDPVQAARLWVNLRSVFRYRNLNDPQVSIEETSRRLSSNYKSLFVNLAVDLVETGDKTITVTEESGEPRRVAAKELALEALDFSEYVLPLDRFGIDPGLAASVVSLYVILDKKERAASYIAYLESLSEAASVRLAPELHYALALALRAVGRDEESKAVMNRLLDEIDDNRIELPNQ